MNFIGILISLLLPLIIYKLFDEKKLIFTIVLRIVFQYFSALNIKEIIKEYNPTIFLIIYFIIIPIIITVGEFSIFNKTSSFISWYILSIIFEFVILYGAPYLFSIF